MRNSRRSWLAFVCGVVVSIAASAATTGADDGAASLSGDAQQVLRWVLRSADHRQRPFAIVDKRRARIHVFEPSGVPAGTAPVLLGSAGGDRDAVQNIGTRSVASLLPHWPRALDWRWPHFHRGTLQPALAEEA
jgi:hypothetical protein